MRRPLAAIDLGTNTLRVLVAEADAAAGLVPYWVDQAVVRLGEGVAARGMLAPCATERALAVVHAYRGHPAGGCRPALADAGGARRGRPRRGAGRWAARAPVAWRSWRCVA